MKKVYICGLTGSGKGLLRPLLDGHPNIVDCPIQGFGFTFFDEKFRAQPTKPTILMVHLMQANSSVRKITVDYPGSPAATYSMADLMTAVLKSPFMHMFTECALAKKIHASSSLTKIRFVDFDFDLYDFLRDFSERATRIGHFTSAEALQDCFYDSFIQSWKNICPYDAEYFHFIQTTGTGLHIIETVFEHNVQAKVVAVLRDPIALSYRNALNQLLKYTGPKPDAEIRSLLTGKHRSLLYSIPFIEKVKEYRRSVLSKAKQNRNLLVVDFDDLVFRTKETMNRVAGFLEIPLQDSLYHPTLNGQPLEDEALKFTGQVNDDPQKILHASDLEILESLYHDKSGNSATPVSTRARLVGAALRVRHSIVERIK